MVLSKLKMEASNQPITKDIDQNKSDFKKAFENSSDIVFREMNSHRKIRILLIYVDGMIDVELIESNLLKPILFEGQAQGFGAIGDITNMCERELYSGLQVKKLSDFDEIAEHILKGDLAILADGEGVACVAQVKKVPTRSIEESTSEPTLRGAKESFTEDIRTNTVLIRKKFATTKLKLEAIKIGKLTKTNVVVAYIEGIVDPNLLDEVLARINRIEMDGIFESGYIEESIEDTHFSPFPQMLNTERPDVVSAEIMEGKVAILTDGTPYVLVVPMTFWSGLQAPDDYYERFLYVFLNRSIRYFFSLFSVLLPSFYIALTNFHQELVPSKLMISIAALRERAPFPTLIEVLMMEVMFEGLREAGIRLPKTIGPLVSVVGALVIGEAAVRAGIISSPIVIVVSAAGIASFIIPRYRFGIPLRILRFPLILLSGLFGLFGLVAGIVAILIHLVQLRPFGMPYLSPVAPIAGQWLKDWWIRWPYKLTNNADQRRKGGNA